MRFRLLGGIIEIRTVLPPQSCLQIALVIKFGVSVFLALILIPRCQTVDPPHPFKTLLSCITLEKAEQKGEKYSDS